MAIFAQTILRIVGRHLEQVVPDQHHAHDGAERGIKQIDGVMSKRRRIEPEHAMKADRSLGLPGVLLEPPSGSELSKS